MENCLAQLLWHRRAMTPRVDFQPRTAQASTAGLTAASKKINALFSSLILPEASRSHKLCQLRYALS
jgi:hypothetical protein